MSVIFRICCKVGDSAINIFLDSNRLVYSLAVPFSDLRSTMRLVSVTSDGAIITQAWTVPTSSTNMFDGCRSSVAVTSGGVEQKRMHLPRIITHS